MTNFSSWKTPVLTSIAKAITKGLSTVLFCNNPVAGIAVDELTSCGIDFIAGKLDSNNKSLHKIIQANCKESLSPANQQYMDIICAAVEISVESITMGYTIHDMNAHTLAHSLSAQYTHRYNAHFDGEILEQIELYLPRILEEIILDIGGQFENDPEFQIAWKQYITSRLTHVEEQKREVGQ